MIKYCETGIVFREFPDEITLAINLSNCPHHCKGCHSPHLQTDTGTELTEEELYRLLYYYENRITCVGFMGGDADIEGLVRLFKAVKEKFPRLKVGWYSGNDLMDAGLYGMEDYIEYIKVGHYDSEKGPLDSPTTNQKLYRRIGNDWEHVPMYSTKEKES